MIFIALLVIEVGIVLDIIALTCTAHKFWDEQLKSRGSLGVAHFQNVLVALKCPTVCEYEMISVIILAVELNPTAFC